MKVAACHWPAAEVGNSGWEEESLVVEYIQEDRYLTYSVKNDWSEKRARKHLEDFHAASLECTNKYKRAGSSAISTIYLPSENKIVWSNMGDGQATIFIYTNKNNSPWHATVWPLKLNTRHEPFGEKEHARLMQTSNVSMEYNQLHLHADGNESRIGVSRAYGASDFSRIGLSKELESGTLDLSIKSLIDKTRVHYLELNEFSRIFLFTASMGFYVSTGGVDMSRVYADKIKLLLSENPNLEASEIFEGLQSERFIDTPCKNCTGVFVELNTPHKTLNERPIVAQIFDGLQDKKLDGKPVGLENGDVVSQILVNKALENIEKDNEFSLISSSERSASSSLGFASIALLITASICGAAYYLAKIRPDYTTALRTKVSSNIDFKNITEKLSKLSSWVQESLGKAFSRR